MYYNDFKLAFEYDGKKWHTENLNDKIKNKLCKLNNITLIRIKENKKDKPYDDVVKQIISNLHIINTVSKKKFIEKYILAIKLDTKKIFSKILDEESIKETISKYVYYKDFRLKENALYMRLKKRRLLDVYTNDLIRDKKDKFKKI